MPPEVEDDKKLVLEENSFIFFMRVKQKERQTEALSEAAVVFQESVLGRRAAELLRGPRLCS